MSSNLFSTQRYRSAGPAPGVAMSNDQYIAHTRRGGKQMPIGGPDSTAPRARPAARWATVIGHQHHQAMLGGIALKQRTVRCVAAFADQHTGGVYRGARLCGLPWMAGVGEVCADRQRNSVIPPLECNTALPRDKRHLFAGMQMLLGVNRKRTVCPSTNAA